jgi:hypothetical protein
MAAEVLQINLEIAAEQSTDDAARLALLKLRLPRVLLRRRAQVAKIAEKSGAWIE